MHSVLRALGVVLRAFGVVLRVLRFTNFSFYKLFVLRALGVLQGVDEQVEEESKGKEFYIPHKPVVHETAESTKTGIVHDASACPNERSPSLNECLEPGPALQNQLWSALVGNRFHPVALSGDLKQAFLQVHVREDDRDALRFHWLKDLTTRKVKTLRFTQALFGLSTSPFLLGGVIEQHLQNMQSDHGIIGIV